MNQHQLVVLKKALQRQLIFRQWEGMQQDSDARLFCLFVCGLIFFFCFVLKTSLPTQNASSAPDVRGGVLSRGAGAKESVGRTKHDAMQISRAIAFLKDTSCRSTISNTNSQSLSNVHANFILVLAVLNLFMSKSFRFDRGVLFNIVLSVLDLKVLYKR